MLGKILTGSSPRVSERAGIRALGMILAGLLFLCLAPSRGAGMNPPATEIATEANASPVKRFESVPEIIDHLSPRLVGIRIEREKDSEGPALSRQRLRSFPASERDAILDYFSRPPGVVSGILLDGDGHVLTSLYNLSGKFVKVEVILADGVPRSSGLIGKSTIDDLAMLKTAEALPADLQLPPLRWADSTAFQTGRLVLALGRSPDPEKITATLGIISAPGRNFGRSFQTDAAMNYGNSGGAIIDLEGRILGIAGFIGHVEPYQNWGFNSGIGFGTRADTVQKTLNALMQGKNLPALLGIQYRGADTPQSQGIKITEVMEGSAAKDADVRKDDVIEEIDGQAIQSFMQLRRLIIDKFPGDSVLLKLDRNGEKLEIQVRLKSAE